MTTNLLDRVPVPGSFGVQPSTNVVLHIQTTDAILQSTVTIKLNGVNAILNGAFQTGYTGTIVTDGAGGWNVTINPTTNFAYNATVTVLVQATETTGPTPFSQSYAFQIVRNIAISPSVCYFEEGDVLEADVWVHEDQTARPELVNVLTLTLRLSGELVDQVVINNPNHDMAGESGAFRIRLLHPMQINQQMTFDCSASIDGYAAPGLGTITVSKQIEWESRLAQVTPSIAQPNNKIGTTLPQATPSEYGTSGIQQTTLAEHEVVDLQSTGDELVGPTTLVDLDFLNTQQYLQALEGDLSYAGGGNRLLNGVEDTTDWFLQEADELAVTFGARTLVEGQAINLLPHSTFDENQFTITLDDGTIRADVELSEFVSGVNQLEYAVEGSVTFDGTDRFVTISSPKVDLIAGQPVMCSVLARTALRDDKVTLDTFKMRVRFFNVSNTQVASFDYAYDIFDFEKDTFSLMEALVPSPSIPVSATQVSFDIVVGSWEGCDLMNLWLVAPMIEHALFTTSRVIGVDAPVARLHDDFRIQQYGNINQRQGRITLTYAPQYEGSPPVNVTLFDTRSAATLRSGYAVRHRTDGKFELIVTDDAGTTTTLVTASAVPVTFGEELSIAGQWTATTLRLFRDTTVLAEQSGVYPQPKTIQPQISIGQKIDGTEPLYGEIHHFVSNGIV